MAEFHEFYGRALAYDIGWPVVGRDFVREVDFLAASTSA
jgi:hypothetical protein